MQAKQCRRIGVDGTNKNWSEQQANRRRSLPKQRQPEAKTLRRVKNF
jgi:hypothetical protein